MNLMNVIFFAVSFWVALGIGDTAHAYLDPGTGSVMLQVFLGGIVGALTVIRLYWKRIRSVFSRRSTKEA